MFSAVWSLEWSPVLKIGSEGARVVKRRGVRRQVHRTIVTDCRTHRFVQVFSCSNKMAMSVPGTGGFGDFDAILDDMFALEITSSFFLCLCL